MVNRNILWALLGSVVIGLTFTGTLHKLDSSSWAAWVQAIGSIVAIFGSFLLAEHTFAKARQIDAETKVSDEIHRLALIESLLKGLHLEIGKLQHAIFENRVGDVVQYQDGILDEYREALKAIPILEVPDADLVYRLTSLPAAVTAVRYIFQIARAHNAQEEEFEYDLLLSFDLEFAVDNLKSRVDYTLIRAASAKISRMKR